MRLAQDSWWEGPGFDSRCGRPLPTGWVGVSIMWPAETEVMVSQLCLICGSTSNCQALCFGARPRYSLVVDEDVKKPNKQTDKQTSMRLGVHMAAEFIKFMTCRKIDDELIGKILLTKFVNMNSNRVELHLHKMYKASTVPRSFWKRRRACTYHRIKYWYGQIKDNNQNLHNLQWKWNCWTEATPLISAAHTVVKFRSE